MAETSVSAPTTPTSPVVSTAKVKEPEPRQASLAEANRMMHVAARSDAVRRLASVETADKVKAASHDVVRVAQEEAEGIIRKAQQEASSILEKAKTDADRLLTHTQNECAKLRHAEVMRKSMS